MNPFGLPSAFHKALEHAVATFKEWLAEEVDIIRISSHIDADGLAAAGILSASIYRQELPFHLRILRQLDPEFIIQLAEEKRKCYIFSDFGSGQLNLIKKFFKTEKILILDHHEPLTSSNELPDNILEINPHLYGVDGSSEISGAGVSFLFSYYLAPEKNLDLLPLALVGAVGDTQDKAKQHSLIGLNAEIAKFGVEKNLIRIEKDLYFQYSEMKPIHKAIMETTDPYLPNLTGNEEACIKFLGEIGIPLQMGDNWRTISELSTEEKKTLATHLTQQILSHGGSSEQASNLVGTLYKFINETELYLKDARTYASLLNACGRTRHPGTGVAVCLGDRNIHYKLAQDYLHEYQTQLNVMLERLKHPGMIHETDHLQYFYGSSLDERMIGTICTIAVRTKIVKPSKPLIGFGNSEHNDYKISARAQDHLVQKGLHLGKALRKTISELELDPTQYGAGGHDAAAGARIPATSDIQFIEVLDRIIKEQLQGKNNH
ncbi:MAG: DHHA1 domain-containing protein [Candidatus Helarchaeota archaeon]